MMLVVPAAPTGAAANTPISMAAPTGVNEYSFTIKPNTTALIFGANVPPSSTQLAYAKMKAEAAATSAAAAAGYARPPPPPPEAFRLENQVTVMADCMPKTKSAEYQKILAARQLQLHGAKRTTQALDESGQTTVTTHALPLKRAGPKKLEKPAKRVRMDNEDAFNAAIFQVMTRPDHQFVTIAKLALELQQPLTAVSERVHALCVKQEEGPNKGMYQLKPEYRLAIDANSSGSAPDTAMTTTGTPPMEGASGHQSMQGMVGFQVKQEGVKQGGVKREY